MKVLFIANAFPSPDLPNKGAFNYRGARQIKAKVENLQVLHLRAWRPGRPVWQSYDMDGISVWAFSFPFYDLLGDTVTGLVTGIYKNVLFYSYLKDRIKAFDVIHTVGLGFSGIVGAFVSEKTGKPHIAQCIGSDVNFVIPQIKNKIGVKGFDKYVDLFVCNSKELETEVLLHFPMAKVATIYRGVDLDEFGFVQKDLTNKEVKFLYLGGLSARKGNPFGMNLKGGITLLKAWKAFLDENAGNDFKYSLQFGGPDVTQEMVENILGDSIAKYNIQLPGYLDKFSISKHMADATVVIVPSMAEGLPNVAMEAAATGCIVVGTKVGGIPEVVEDRETGYLFEAGNDLALTQVFKEISLHLQILPQMTAKSRARMENLFDSKSFAENYLKAYNTNG